MPFGRNIQVDTKYIWTTHSRMKMQHYRLTESRIKRIIRHPTRIEEGVLENGIAAMQPADGSGQALPDGRPGKNYSEIWVMYVVAKSNVKGQKSKVKVITAWRYPGKSPSRDPIPAAILKEVQGILF